MIRVTVWNEGVHEVESPEIAAVYPHGIHGQIKSFLDTQEDIEVRTATLNDHDCGLPPEVLENTDVLIWWGHKAHDEVPDELVERVHDRVLRGMGFETAQANQIWSTFTAGLVTISLNSTAYMMEVLRGGIESIDPGQAEAARSLGLSQWQAMRKVVFPQGIKNAIPALTNELIINIKDSSVLSVIGVFDLMYATTTVAGVYYRQMEVYCVALVVYLILTLVASRLLEAFGKKLGAEAPATLPSSN